MRLAELIERSQDYKLTSVFVKPLCGFLFGINNILDELNGYLRTKGIGGSKYSSLKSYRNIHKGQRCFIIATGPSLTLGDLQLLKNEYTFGMNSIVKKYKEIDFRPTYYGIQDRQVYSALQNEILHWYKGAKNIFVANRIASRFAVDENWNIFPLNQFYNAYNDFFNNTYDVKFSGDIFNQVYSGFSITYTLIEIAVYMGFSEIYLIGADCTFLANGPNHFAGGEHGAVDIRVQTSQDRQLAGYKAAKLYAAKNEIKILNATRGGMLEIFPRVNFDQLMESKTGKFNS